MIRKTFLEEREMNSVKTFAPFVILGVLMALGLVIGSIELYSTYQEKFNPTEEQQAIAITLAAEKIEHRESLLQSHSFVKVQKLRFSKHINSGLCFATWSLGSNAGVLTYVPCDKVPEGMLVTEDPLPDR